MSKKTRARTESRIRERDARKLVNDRQRLAELEPGGSASRPIDVASSSVIPVRARSIPCPLCAGSLHLDQEGAITIDGQRLRNAEMICQRCGVARTLWFRITTPLAN